MNPFILIIYAVFIISAGVFIHGNIKYHDVKSWPSVDAEIISRGGSVTTTPSYTRYGVSSSTFDSRYVVFRYVVEGKEYQSSTASPNGDVGLLPYSTKLKAYYKPSAPDVAVLRPVLYKGVGALVGVMFSGIMVGVHLLVTVPEVFKRKR